MTRRTSLPAVVLALLPALAPAQGAPSPESVIGFRVGEDRKLADWTQIVQYFRALDAASPRVLVEDVGQTTEGRPFLVATITSEANMARLDELRRANLRLSDPRGLPEDEARRLLAEGRTIVSLNYGIHSTEVAAPQTAMEEAWRLATATDADTLQVLDRTVILMIPSHNPDGTQKVTEWYRRSLGTAWEGGAIPFLYHPYVGHDNNRDWYMFTQAETRLTVRHVYDRWRPQVVHDLHQMGMRDARIFVPPYVDPWEPNVDPALIAAANAIGSHVAGRLTTEGRRGAVIHALYDAWTPARAYPHTHGGVRVLSETASARMATPVEVKFDELEAGVGYDAKEASWNFPAPWPGGTWRLRDIVDYQLTATRALLEHAAGHREYWLRTFLEVNRRASERREPYAFIVPAAQKDPLAATRLLQVMRLGAVEVHRARAPFEAAGRRFAAGTHVIPMAQPFSAFAKSLLERQRYPDLRLYKGGPPLRPYDVTAHTLPLLMGVDVVAAAQPFSATLDPVAEVQVPPGRVEPGRGRTLALGHKTGDLVALGRLLRAGVPVRWATDGFVDQDRRFPAGALLVPASARALVEAVARELGVVAAPVAADPPALRLRRPRVGLYQSWVASMDEGWTRYVFEKEMGVDYQTIHDQDVRAGTLHDRFDVIVLPDQGAEQMVAGYRPGSLPAEYTGGLGQEGVAALRAFAEAGGTLIALDSASELPLAHFGLDIADALASVRRGREREDGGVEGGSEFYGPGTILLTRVEGGSPLHHGLDPETPVWFEHSPAFDVRRGRVALRYPHQDPLLSGWLLGGSFLRGKAALVETRLGQGRVVLFGFRPQYRAQSWATYI
ncbi:MAG TPA: M14 metallopeptidase family protein, partial [Vicinamibacteria bacterium]